MPDLLHLIDLRRLAIGHNEQQFLGESTWSGVTSGLAASFLPVLALRWGASAVDLALLSAMPFVVYTFFSIPAGRFFERASQRNTILALCTFLWRLNYLLIALLPWVLPGHLVLATIAIATLAIFPASVNNVAVIAALGDLTTPERRSWVIGMRRSVISLTAAVATLCGGWLLTMLPFPGNYQIILLLAFLAALMAVFYLSRLDYSAAPASGKDFAAPNTPGASILSLRYLLREHRAFCLFSLGAFLFTGGFYMAYPLFPLYQVKILGANEAWVGLLTTVQQITMFVTFLLWARAGQRFGLGFVLGCSTMAWSLVALAISLTTSLPQLLPVYVWYGCFWAGWNMSVYLGLLEVCPESRRPSFIGLYTAGGSVVGFLCPLLGAQLVQLYGIHVALIGASLVSASGALVYLVTFPIRKPRLVNREVIL